MQAAHAPRASGASNQRPGMLLEYCRHTQDVYSSVRASHRWHKHNAKLRNSLKSPSAKLRNSLKSEWARIPF